MSQTSRAVSEVAGLLCFDDPWRELVQAECNRNSYVLVGATTKYDWRWCAVAKGFPVKALAVASVDGVLCFLHLDPPRPVEDLDAYSSLIGRCVAGGNLSPAEVLCTQQYSVLVASIETSNDNCPVPRLRGVLAWSVPDQFGQVVCLQGTSRRTRRALFSL
jgi:hypothetical protein